MKHPYLIVLIDASIFVCLYAFGAAFQSWLGWRGFLATGLFAIPPFLYLWYRMPDEETGQPRPFSEMLILIIAITAGGFIVFDVLQFNPDDKRGSALIGGICFCALCLDKFRRRHRAESNSMANSGPTSDGRD